jgi:hypothetical protein
VGAGRYQPVGVAFESEGQHANLTAFALERGCIEVAGLFVDFSNHALQKCLGAFAVPSEEANHTGHTMPGTSSRIWPAPKCR